MTIYRNTLGHPESQAIVSVFGSDYGRPGTGYLSLSTTSDAPSKKWDYVSLDISNIVNELNAEGWDCIVDKDGYNAPKIYLTHRETQQVIDRQLAITDIEFKNAKTGYIRFGKPPKNGQSHNYRDDCPEPGVSVFNAQFASNGNYRLIVNHVEIASYYSVCDRPAYRIWGKKIGTGVDGEPCLKISKIKKL